VCLYPQAQAMKRALSEIHLLATQKVRSFFQFSYLRWRASPTMAHVSQRVPLSTSTGYEAWRYQKSIFLLRKSAVVFSIFLFTLARVS